MASSRTAGATLGAGPAAAVPDMASGNKSMVLAAASKPPTKRGVSSPSGAQEPVTLLRTCWRTIHFPNPSEAMWFLGNLSSCCSILVHVQFQRHNIATSCPMTNTTAYNLHTVGNVSSSSIWI
eukprot:CAMPEP_0197654960 /NCGR_PEP_ID=MMETSP1338-20131121/39162_1 /TAXON_ID=43686 ORGANISM="Pelagodinium beii, Strain RCC1491" /NCGR_SAMPLE_ID=MMETSP1338 /ASSEMBLY_ACC=CAM_ASM_000754 /LENGTH=122 /DNA_ID=CAMNT_0043230507 /DNA_START=824 /DNA_END=1191 /DNA_ORIENTATION=-